MGLIKCYECKHVVSSEAAECSHCGASFRREGMSGAKVFWLVVIFGAFACALAYWL